MPEYKELTATQIAAGVAEGKLSAVEITQEALHLARTEGKELNAFITVCEEKALAQARAVDSAIKERKGERSPMPLRGKPLSGVPVAIKDNISYTDYPTTCGSRILNGYIPPFDATAVSRLIEAGAVIIGKTNMDEFAMGSSSETSCYGPVKHPLDHSLTTGGSSGGSAAAVAQKIVPIAYGSETGGSVRQPASFCGLYGFKPSYGSVSRYGLVAYCSSTDQISPFARTPQDLAVAYQTICGHDPRDATSVTFDHPDYARDIEAARKFRIGVIRECFTEGLDPHIEKITREAIKSLEQLGHTIVDVSLPSLEYAIAMYYIFAPAEASANLARFDGVKFGLRETGDEGTLDQMYAATRAAGFGTEVQRRIMLGTYALSSGYYEAYYLKACKVRELMRREFEETFRKVDLLISPTAPTAAFRRGEKINDPLAMYLSDIYTIPASLVGIPAISVPFGSVKDGRPVGIQFITAAFDDLSLFQIAEVMRKIA